MNDANQKPLFSEEEIQNIYDRARASVPALQYDARKQGLAMTRAIAEISNAELFQKYLDVVLANGELALKFGEWLDENAALRERVQELEGLLHAEPKPIDMVLYCPFCFSMHVDCPEPEKGWENPPHKSHLCHKCGAIWRPASVPTNGVSHVPPGENDTSLGRSSRWTANNPPGSFREAAQDYRSGIMMDLLAPSEAVPPGEAWVMDGRTSVKVPIDSEKEAEV